MQWQNNGGKMKLWTIKFIVLGLLIVMFLWVAKFEFNCNLWDLWIKGNGFLDHNLAKQGYHRAGAMYIALHILGDIALAAWFLICWGRKEK